MNIAFIGCSIMSREIYYEAYKSENKVKTWWLNQGLHDTPLILNKLLEKKIEEIEIEQKELKEDNKYDYICLGYGLCSNGIIGLESKTISLVIPKCDDCIALFLGGRKKYETLFKKYKGIYWYNIGWIEQAFTPSKENYEKHKKEYEKIYEKEIVEYLMKEEIIWTKQYQYGIYINNPIIENNKYWLYAKKATEYFGWNFKEVKGEMNMFHNLLNGVWDNKNFLICPPKHKIILDYGKDKIKCVSIE